jgi:hypothetical protein
MSLDEDDVLITVIAPTRSLPRFPAGTLVLVQDNWNDYSFQTQYQLHLATAQSSEHIGAIKILKKGQTGKDGLQVVQSFDQLGEEFVSVGESLDFSKERLRRWYPGTMRRSRSLFA